MWMEVLLNRRSEGQEFRVLVSFEHDGTTNTMAWYKSKRDDAKSSKTRKI